VSPLVKRRPGKVSHVTGGITVQFRIDTTDLTFIVSTAPRPVTRYGSEEIRTDKNGQQIHAVELIVLSDDGGDKIRVKVPGRPELRPRSEVRVTNLQAMPWEQNGKSGVAFSASSIESATKSVKAAS
jgi:hypothetical protein